MLFNNDSMFVLGSLIFIGVVLFTSYNYYIFTTKAGMIESLVNTSSTPLAPSENTIPIPIPEPGKLASQYIEAGVQTVNTPASLWQSFKNWLIEAFSVNTSEIESIGMEGVNNWRNNLDSVQSVALHDSESSLDSVSSNSTVQELLAPNDSASMVSGPVTEVATNVVNAIEIIDPTFIITTVNGRELVDPFLMMFGG